MGRIWENVARSSNKTGANIKKNMKSTKKWLSHWKSSLTCTCGFQLIKNIKKQSFSVQTENTVITKFKLQLCMNNFGKRKTCQEASLNRTSTANKVPSTNCVLLRGERGFLSNLTNDKKVQDACPKIRKLDLIWCLVTLIS